MVGLAEHHKKIYITAGHIQYLQRDHPAVVLEYSCRVNFILTDHHFFLPFMQRQCVVVGPAEHHKKLHHRRTYICGGITLLVHLGNV